MVTDISPETFDATWPNGDTQLRLLELLVNTGSELNTTGYVKEPNMLCEADGKIEFCVAPQAGRDWDPGRRDLTTNRPDIST
jgi:hypothetical protein